jgi:hypothetical protein
VKSIAYLTFWGCFSSELRSKGFIEQFLESIQSAQQLGAVSTGIFPSQVAKSEGSREPALPPVEIQPD